MTSRAQGQGRKASPRQARELGRATSDRVLDELARSPSPAPDWARDPKLLPKHPPKRAVPTDGE